MMINSARSTVTYEVPANFQNKTLTLSDILKWNTEAYSAIRKGTLPCFDNCVFPTGELKQVCDASSNPNVHLALSPVIIEETSANHAVKNVSMLAYLMDGNKLISGDKVAVSNKLNQPIVHQSTKWKNGMFSIPKENNKMGFEVPTDFAPRSPTVAPPKSGRTLLSGHSITSISFVNWIKKFDIEACIQAYPKEILVDEEYEEVKNIHFHFKKQILEGNGFLNERKYPYIAFMPVVFFNNGSIIPGGPVQNYVTIICVPLDEKFIIQSIEEQVTKTEKAEIFLTSGCTYPRPWDRPRVCSEVTTHVSIW